MKSRLQMETSFSPPQRVLQKRLCSSLSSLLNTLQTLRLPLEGVDWGKELCGGELASSSPSDSKRNSERGESQGDGKLARERTSLGG